MGYWDEEAIPGEKVYDPATGEAIDFEEYRRRLRRTALGTEAPAAMDTNRAGNVFGATDTPETDTIIGSYDPTKNMSPEEKSVLIGAPGEKYSQYMDWSKKNPVPDREQYKPGLARKIVAIATAIEHGLSGRPELGLKYGQEVMDDEYNRAMEDYSRKEEQLRRAANLEESERRIRRSANTSEARLDQANWKMRAGALERRGKQFASGARAVEDKWKSRMEAEKIASADRARQDAERRREDTDRRSADAAARAADAAARAARAEEAKMNQEDILSPSEEFTGRQNTAEDMLAERRDYIDYFKDVKPGFPDQGKSSDIYFMDPNNITEEDEKILQRNNVSVEEFNRRAKWLRDEIVRKTKERYVKPNPYNRVRRIR
jgi:hypothetical protein